MLYLVFACLLSLIMTICDQDQSIILLIRDHLMILSLMIIYTTIMRALKNEHMTNIHVLVTSITHTSVYKSNCFLS